MSSSNSIFKSLKFLSIMSFASLVSVTPKYFMLFEALVKGDVSLVSLSASLYFMYRWANHFFSVDLVSCHITEGIYQL